MQGPHLVRRNRLGPHLVRSTVFHMAEIDIQNIDQSKRVTIITHRLTS